MLLITQKIVTKLSEIWVGDLEPLSRILRSKKHRIRIWIRNTADIDEDSNWAKSGINRLLFSQQFPQGSATPVSTNPKYINK